MESRERSKSGEALCVCGHGVGVTYGLIATDGVNLCAEHHGGEDEEEEALKAQEDEEDDSGRRREGAARWGQVGGIRGGGD